MSVIIVMHWKLIGVMLKDEECLRILSENEKFVRECKGQLTKRENRYYWTPVTLHKNRSYEQLIVFEMSNPHLLNIFG